MNIQFLMAQEERALTLVAVGEAEPEKIKLAVAPAQIDSDFTLEENKQIKTVTDLLFNNFLFYKKIFSIRPMDKLTGAPLDKLDSPNFDYWKLNKIDFVIQSRFYKNEKKRMAFEIQLVDISEKKASQKGVGFFEESRNRVKFHIAADEIFKSITGKESIFKSFVVFVSDKMSGKGKYVKELYMMNFDGRNVRRLTYHHQTVVSPAISNDKKSVLYSLIALRNGKQNVDLYIMDLETRKSKLLSTRKGINSGGVFLPGDKKILLTLSYTGNAEIFELDIETKKLRYVTKHYADDVDPSVSSDGSLMTFLSSRAGRAMIYTLDPSKAEKGVKRISFVGRFNATPRFSPDGKTIAFSSWLDERFDIFRINSDGNGLVRLTKDFGSNESPTFSNDGDFIAFSSQRVLSKKKAIQNIYIMDKDGDILGPLTHNMGNCISPRWSK
jgi:TolB protein